MSRFFGFEVSEGLFTKRFPTPVGTVSYLSEKLSIDSSETQVYFMFYSDENYSIPVLPTGGTIMSIGTPKLDKEFESQLWLRPSNYDGIIDATKVSPDLSTYVVPQFVGAIDKIRITFTDITGAAFCMAVVWQK